MKEAPEFAENVTSDPNFARLEKDIEAVKNDISHLSQQISDAVGALTQIAQNQARRGVRRARVKVEHDDVRRLRSRRRRRQRRPGRGVVRRRHDRRM